jgi:hypothetical protein
MFLFSGFKLFNFSVKRYLKVIIFFGEERNAANVSHFKIAGNL